MLRKPLAVTFALAAALSSAVANAGQTAPLSALPVLPAATSLKGAPTDKVPGLTLTTSGIGRNRETKWHELTAGAGFCISDTDSGARWSNNAGSSENTSPRELDLNHLVEKDGKTVLERTKIRFDPMFGTVTATARTHVEMVEVARSQAGVVVFAYREGTTIMLIARNADSGTESHTLVGDTGAMAFVSADGCTFSGVRIDARKPEGGAIAQLAVTVPPPKGEKTPSRFVVDASLSKVARDPEPKLSVRIRPSL